jgi:hypothetical protein
MSAPLNPVTRGVPRAATPSIAAKVCPVASGPTTKIMPPITSAARPKSENAILSIAPILLGIYRRRSSAQVAASSSSTARSYGQRLPTR